MIYKTVSDLIGNTPILQCEKFSKYAGLKTPILAKLECFNPAGSVKDRAALYMIEAAEKSGKLRPGATIIEPTSGNTGIGLASVACQRGYKVILTMPDTMSVERRSLLKAYGAEIVLTDGAKGMKGAIEKAGQLLKQTDGAWTAGQFENPDNALAHYDTTGPEIYSQTDGKIDIFVSGVGTGGTITGVGKYLKEQNPEIKIIAVEPFGSPVLSGGQSGKHMLQGIGAGFVPKVLDTHIYDDIVTVKDDNALEYGKMFAKSEGILVGISSGAALWAASFISKQQENQQKTIVALLPDTGDRYLSTQLFS